MPVAPLLPAQATPELGSAAPAPSPTDYLMAAAELHGDGTLKALSSGASQNQALSRVGRSRKRSLKVLK